MKIQPLEKLHPLKKASLLLFFTFSYLLFNLLGCTKPTPTHSLTCQSPWGNVKTHSSCDFKLASADSPTLIRIQKKPEIGNLKNETLLLDLILSGTQSLVGLEIRLNKNGLLRATYVLPLYGEKSNNFLQDDLPSQLSLPFSSLKLQENGDSSSLEIDEVEIFINAQNQGPLNIKILNMSWIPRQPSKGFVSITFDDGYSSQYFAAEIMKKQGYSGTAYLIPSAIDQSSYLTSQQINDMKKLGWDISSHFETPIPSLKKNEKSQSLKNIFEQIQKIGSRFSAQHFAYPLGQFDKETLEEIKNLFSTARLAGGGFESLPPADPLKMRAINVTPQLSPTQLKEMALKAIENGDWAIFMFHYLDQPDKGDLNYSSTDFRLFIEGLKKNKNSVKTISEVFQRSR